VRIISATNVDLRQGAGLKHFREDLFYRLNVFQVIAPPLRERREDIPMLCEYFIGKYNRENGTEIQGISKEALTLMRNYSWPGNVRELETLMERACVDADKGIIDVDNLTRFGGRNLQHQLHGAPNHSHIRSLKEGRESGEKDAIEAALKAANGNKTRTAQMLGIHRTYLYHKLKELGIVED
jgi:transcriptional regulator with PAS, ATPase and Fis domain